MLISLVVPVLNEEHTIPVFLKSIQSNENLKEYNIEIIFVNDGSSDTTGQILFNCVNNNDNIIAINFSRNFGKESALLAGISYATGDAVIPIDVDLQDPIEVIPQLINEWRNGFDIVLAKRMDRTSDTINKRLTSKLFYLLFNKIADHKIESDVGDFRLMSRRVIEEVKLLPESNLFMKGLLSWVGFPTTKVEYSRPERIEGETKFNFLKLLNLAIEGITSFSSIPLRVWSIFGMVIAIFSIVYAFFIIISKIIWGNSVAGYPSLMVAVLFLGGVQLIGIGVLGEYIGRIYQESKRRPRYIIESIIKK